MPCQDDVYIVKDHLAPLGTTILSSIMLKYKYMYMIAWNE